MAHDRQVSIHAIDLERVAFSVRGNWLSLLAFGQPESQPGGGEDTSRFHGLGAPEGPLGPGLYLRSNHARGVVRRELFRIRPVVDGTPIDVAARGGRTAGADGWAVANASEDGSMLLVSANGTDLITIGLSSLNRISIRTLGCGLELEAVPHHHASAYADGAAAWVFNLRHALRRYRVQVSRGDAVLEQDVASTDTAVLSTRMQLMVRPAGEPASVELSIAEHWSAYRPDQDEEARDATAPEEQGAAFAAFSTTFPEVHAHREPAAELARWILWSRAMTPSGRLARETVFMDLGTMDQIWSWDNLFNMSALAQGQPDLALDQLLIFADHQDENGAYPDGMNDMFYHYNFVKPPVHGIILDWISERVPSFLSEERTRPIYETVARFAEFWLQYRMDTATGLPFYVHGNETQDNSTFFDGGLPVTTPDLPAYLSRTLVWLANNARAAGDAARSAYWQERSAEIVDSLTEHLWTGAGFAARRVSDGGLVESENVLRLAPLLVADRLTAPQRDHLVADFARFLTPHGIATEAPDSPKYREDAYWRGPIWAPTTFLMVRALQKAGERAQALDLAQRFCTTCERSGFAENFGAITGEGFRDAGYTWTASVYLWFAAWLADEDGPDDRG